LYIGEEIVARNDNVKYLGLNFSSGPSLVLGGKHLMHKFYAVANALCGYVKFASLYVGVISVSIFVFHC